MSERIRVVVVDDEPLALDLLCDLLARDPQVELVGRCGDGRGALRLLEDQRPDVVFLDIEMPERGGLDVARALTGDDAPVVIFVTAYSQHAAQAFEVQALDYVVKPFSDARLAAVSERAKRRVREKRLGDLAGQMASLSLDLKSPSPSVEWTGDVDGGAAAPYLQRIPVPSDGRSLILDVEQVLWIESCDYYARLHTLAGRHLVRIPLSTFEEKLDPRQFARVHRKAIVQLNQICEVQQLLKGSRQVVLRDGTVLPVSRSRLRNLESRLVPQLNHS